MRRLLIPGSLIARAAVFSAVWLFLFPSSPLSAASLETPTLIVRVYDAYGLTPPEATAARAALQDVFAAAGVTLRWRDCRHDGLDPCADGLAPNDLVIRLLPAPRDPRPGPSPTLGYSSLQPGGPRGRLATVYPDRVRTLAGRAGRDEGSLLGAAIAHEAGHLLLGTSVHASAGLMRAQWTARSLRAAHDADGLFLPQERSQVRDAVAARTPRPGAQPAWTIAAAPQPAPASSNH